LDPIHKFEEAEADIPYAQELQDFAQHEYTATQVKQMELVVLKKLDWRLATVTPYHFLGYYLAKAVLFSDDTMHGKPLVKQANKYIKKYAEFFGDLCLQEYAFQVYLPSVLSAAILSASRKALRIRSAPSTPLQYH
jgi:hypothetical protein